MSIKSILVVDDSPAHLEQLHNAVSALNARILTATNGKDAVAKVKAEKPDVVLMDVVMDELDGYGACREMKADPSTQDIPVIFVTTKDQRADKIWAEKVGGEAMITKPYQQQQIIDAIQQCA
ncbi:MAG: response regulator [Gammaproteobacteria bacterium]|nr:response regulator [Gammaproteobacteria bacterium]